MLAVIREAAEKATETEGPLAGYPPWLIVLAGTLVAVVALWIFAKVMKWALWVLIIIVFIGGVALAGKMAFGL